MKSRFSSVISFIVLVLYLLLLSSCPSPLSYTGDTVDTTKTAEATVAVDPIRGLAVLTEPDGRETVVKAVEGDNTIGCEKVTDYVLFDTDSGGRHQSGGNHPRAIILGVRPDGRPGVWIVYPGGIIVIPEGDGGDITSELLEAVSDADGFRWDHGWNYEAEALSEDGKIIVGIAENPDAWWLADYLGTTPRVVVWWNLVDKGNGVFFLSRARVVAQYPDWNMDDVKNNRNGRGHRWNRHHRYWLRWFLDRLGLWFFAWADNYLGDLADPEELGDIKPVIIDSVGIYGIYGHDKDGDFAKALITPYKVLSIEKTDPPVNPDPPVNNPPWSVTGPTAPQELTSGMSFKLEVSDDQGIIDNPDDFDPDGDAVEFTAILTRPFGGPGADPDVNISSDGTFYIDVWDSDIAGYFGYYEITISDGELSRTTDFEIVVYFY